MRWKNAEIVCKSGLRGGQNQIKDGYWHQPRTCSGGLRRVEAMTKLDRAFTSFVVAKAPFDILRTRDFLSSKDAKKIDAEAGGFASPFGRDATQT